MNEELKSLLTRYPSARCIAISSPSGGGKSSIVRYLLGACPWVSFSVSACSRAPRPGEKHGVDYYFLTESDFRKRISHNEFLEWEEVYAGMFYGTLLSELERLWQNEHVALFDVDVKGALHLKELLNERILTIFLTPPSLKVLGERLRKRGTETEEQIAKRLQRADYELGFAPQYDICVINDQLQDTQQEVLNIVEKFIGK